MIATVPGFYGKDAVALLDSALTCARSTDNADITLLSRSRDFDAQRYDVRVAGTNDKELKLLEKAVKKLKYPQYFLLALLYKATGRYFLPGKLVVENDVWKEYCAADVIITGLDDSFSTTYRTKPFYRNCLNILLWKLSGKKVVLLGGSIGPFKGRWHEILARYVLLKPDLITLGESVSFEYLSKIGVKNSNMHVTTDLTVPIDSAPEDRVAEIMKVEGISEGHRPLIGVSFSRAIFEQAFPDIHDKKEKYIKFSKEVAGVLDHLVEETGAIIIFMPQIFGPCDYFDDGYTLLYFRQEMKHKDRTIILKNEYKTGELRGLTGKCDFFIGSRTRALVSAAMMQVPFVALDYESFEMKGIIGEMLGCEDCIANARELDHDQLLKKVMDSWDRRDSIKRELGQKTAGMKERALLNTDLLKKFTDQ